MKPISSFTPAEQRAILSLVALSEADTVLLQPARARVYDCINIRTRCQTVVVRKEKPNSADETARVLRIFSMLYDTIAPGMPIFDYDAGSRWYVTVHPLAGELLEIADSIARRTEDD